MTPKEYLSRLFRLQIQIDQRQRQYDRLRRQLTAISGMDYSKPVVQSSPKPDASYTRTVEKLSELSVQIEDLIVRLETERNKIIGQIQALDNPLYVQVLYKRYVECQRLEETAAELHYNYYYLKHLHGYALQEFGRIFLKDSTQ